MPSPKATPIERQFANITPEQHKLLQVICPKLINRLDKLPFSVTYVKKNGLRMSEGHKRPGRS